MKNKKKKSNNSLFVILLLGLVLILVLFFPSIYKFVENINLPKTESSKIKEENKNKEVDSELLESVHRPVMRTDMYSTNTYYSLNEFNVSMLSNSEILLNAFMDLYDGNITNYDGYVPCTNESKQVSSKYIDLRIKNILGKDIKYTLESFNVPEGLNYSGSWAYDSPNSRFIYNGLCTQSNKTIKYYDLEQFIKAEYEDNDLILYYYVGFAKVDGESYIIYSDTKMTNVVASGTAPNIEEIKDVYNKLDNKNKKMYKYTLKNNICSYDEYCLYMGQWVK